MRVRRNPDGTSDEIHLAATDVANHLACRHVTALDLAAARDRLSPPPWRRPGLDALRERGMEHERAYLAHLEAQGVELARGGEGAGLEWTLEAMRRGADAIVQAPLAAGRFGGRADLLRRVPHPSALGAWSYEAIDTKLARETRAGTLLQLALYSDLLAELQGARPERMHVVTPHTAFEPESFRVEEFLAYYRLVRRRLEDAVEDEPETYPEPVPHCDVCRWWPRCDRQRHDDDHLSLVAGLSRLQSRELESQRIVTLEGLAGVPLPLAWTPRRGGREGYTRVREQARVQLAGRSTGSRVHELLDPVLGLGLERLPEPSAGDLFLDLEGDPYVGDAGIEYLFGLASLDAEGEPVYDCEWAISPREEKAAFERVVDAMLIHWERFPDLHVFHYGVYDPAALKRLMGRYATREREIDRMLRAGRFVDLHSIVKQSLRASVERYSIKDLEAFYGYRREMPLAEVAPWRRAAEHALELGQAEALDAPLRQAIEGYNRDDCVSAMRLREWLEQLRAERIAGGVEVPRPAPPEDGAPKEEIDERERRARALAERLMAGVPVDPAARCAEARACALLANLLEWHRREEKAPWWEYYRLLDLSDEELMDEKAAISGLTFVERVGGTARCPIERYSFPAQDTSVREGDKLHARDIGRLGEVEALDQVERTVDIRKTGAAAGRHVGAAFEHDVVPGDPMAKALDRLGEWVANHSVDAPGPYRASRDLLLNLPPRLIPGETLELAGEVVGDAALRLALALDHGVLVIQGPPGAGKTFTSARMICELAAVGRKVGVSAQSHKVIRKLLDDVMVAASKRRQTVTCIQRVRKIERTEGPVREVATDLPVLEVLRHSAASVVGGTAWMWSREEFHEAVDVLFVDEAGQMSLANVLAVAQGAKSLVLVGDPRQLEQPIQGSHPEGADVSALDHVLAGGKTLPKGRGLFLGETWRLHPTICKFTSEAFYEGRLRSRAGLERQAIEGALLSGAGLWHVAVDHDGNQSASLEEVEVVHRLVEALTHDTTWVDEHGARRALALGDVLVVAPYNAQVFDLARRLPRGARVGTVDRFQGQEAPVVIVSMATSAPEDAPRGMEFLYSLNRLNVATSRARAACILVANPRLFEPDCQSPRQMRLANAFCRYLEMATPLSLDSLTPSIA
jgi:uncharacterized protein